MFQVPPACFAVPNVVYSPHTKHPGHPGPTTRPQPHGTLKFLPDDNRPTKAAEVTNVIKNMHCILNLISTDTKKILFLQEIQGIPLG